MVSRLVDAFEREWVSADPARLGSAVTPLAVQGAGSLRLTAVPGAAGVTATRVPAGPLDLRAYDELRLWTYAASTEPYTLELSYRDAGDQPGEDHRWLIPVGRTGGWEQHAFAIAGDRRGAVTDFTVRVATGRPGPRPPRCGSPAGTAAPPTPAPGRTRCAWTSGTTRGP